MYIQMAPKAWFVTVVVTILLFLAAIVATLVCAFIFPEYCVDEVRLAVGSCSSGSSERVPAAGHVCCQCYGFVLWSCPPNSGLCWAVVTDKEGPTSSC
jgi:hypothetical protein